MTPFLVVSMRLLLPFTIPRWPLGGMIAAIAADAADLPLLRTFGWGFLPEAQYQAIDKLFDVYYLSFAAYAALRWPEILARKVLLALFLWRLAGTAAYALSGIRQMLFFAPNIFENLYLLVAFLKKFFPKCNLARPRKLAALLAVSALPKIAQEYVMHFLEFPLGIANTLTFLRDATF